MAMTLKTEPPGAADKPNLIARVTEGGGELPFEGVSESVWVDVIRRMDEVYSELLRNESDLERKNAEEAQKKAAVGDLVGSLMADIKATALAAATTAAVAAPPPEATKTAGQSFQDRVLGWECTDPVALWNARPDLMNAPTPNPSAIKAVCAPERPVPGLRLWWESKVSFKCK